MTKRNPLLCCRQVLLLLLVTLSPVAVAVAVAAPAPELKFLPGIYDLTWYDSAYVAHFEADGSFTEVAATGAIWVGTWTWDAKTRVLAIQENSLVDGIPCAGSCCWHVTLDRNLRSLETCLGQARVTLKKREARP